MPVEMFIFDFQRCHSPGLTNWRLFCNNIVLFNCLSKWLSYVYCVYACDTKFKLAAYSILLMDVRYQLSIMAAACKEYWSCTEQLLAYSWPYCLVTSFCFSARICCLRFSVYTLVYDDFESSSPLFASDKQNVSIFSQQVTLCCDCSDLKRE
jgi:hypothetical protein